MARVVIIMAGGGAGWRGGGGGRVAPGRLLPRRARMPRRAAENILAPRGAAKNIFAPRKIQHSFEDRIVSHLHGAVRDAVVEGRLEPFYSAAAQEGISTLTSVSADASHKLQDLIGSLCDSVGHIFLGVFK